jgi:hypothetical protein
VGVRHTCEVAIFFEFQKRSQDGRAWCGASGVVLCLVVIFFLIFRIWEAKRMGLRAAGEGVHFGSSVAEGSWSARGGDGKWLELRKNETGKGGDYMSALVHVGCDRHRPLSSTRIPKAVFGASEAIAGVMEALKEQRREPDANIQIRCLKSVERLVAEADSWPNRAGCGPEPVSVRHAGSEPWIDGTKSFFISIGEGFSKALAKEGARRRATHGDAFRDER